MKKLLVALVLASFSSTSFALIVGKVDIQQVLLSIKEGQGVRDKLKKSFEEKQKVLQKDEDKIRKMQENFKKQSLVMNDKAKMAKQEEMQKAILDLQQKSQTFQKEIQDMEQRYKKPILEKVKTIVESVSKTAGVDVTFEASTAPVIYAKSEKDLTPEVIKAYDQKYK